MNVRFERKGPLTEIGSYPQWAQDMVGECDSAKRAVVDHEMWSKMCRRELQPDEHARFMVGLWPVIEGFPGYMARSLMKTRYGRSEGDNLARRWLVRNIRVEQNHAEYWLNWAEGVGVSRTEVFQSELPPGSQILAEWCIEASGQDTLAAGIAATNYAVEGATGEWARQVYESRQYADSFPIATRKASLRWLQLHAAYDDQHPWEALEIVCTLLGMSPSVADVVHVTECVRRTYVCMRVFGDRCLYPAPGTMSDLPEAVAA
ncbi:MAG TPA: iron-containing redox enzyme family protein [Rhodanobacteraceae bacterium]